MRKQILLNCTPQETRVAVVEGNQLAELYIERLRDRGIVGDVYKARVQRVLPGMQAAFVDIGLEKAAFLHASDFLHDLKELPPLFSVEGDGEADTPTDGGAIEPFEEEFAIDELPAVSADGGTEAGSAASEARSANPPEGRRRTPRPPREPIEAKLAKGEEIVVQVSKEPMGTKGSRVTSYVSIAGRFLVFMPTTNHIGVSRRIADDGERRRLKELVTSLRPSEGGFIVRTVCEGLSKKEIETDIAYLTREWNRIMRKSESSSAPALLYQDLDQVQRTIRDLFTMEVGRLVVDSPREHQRILDLVDTLAPRLKGRIELYDNAEPLFEHAGVEPQIERALDRKVWLRSGGTLVIERTEALTAIDVNTGRYVGKKSHEETILKTNLEAAEEVVRQLRLRNIGGLIIIDFIDMEKAANRRLVSDALLEAVRSRDKAQSKILKISELGLVEMTRKRTRESLEQLLCAPCPHCEGAGHAKSAETVAYEILRKVQRGDVLPPGTTRLVVKVSPTVAAFLSGSESRVLDQIERIGARKIIVKAQEAFHPAQYEIVAQ